jgi:hypothetical protein
LRSSWRENLVMVLNYPLCSSDLAPCNFLLPSTTIPRDYILQLWKRSRRLWSPLKAFRRRLLKYFDC